MHIFHKKNIALILHIYMARLYWKLYSHHRNITDNKRKSSQLGYESNCWLLFFSENYFAATGKVDKKHLPMNLTRTGLHFPRSDLLSVLEIRLDFAVEPRALNQIMTVNQAKRKVLGKNRVASRICCMFSSIHSRLGLLQN